jgi:4,5-dihydroxyphthalate decarboxylase
MTTLRLKGAFSANPRLAPLLDGTVKIPGVEIEWRSGDAGELHQIHLTENACDVFEFSLCNFMIVRDQPSERKRLQWTALPIFLSKAFMWLNFYVNTDSKITSLADLRGKRVAVPDYHMTAAIWMRIVFRELYGIGPEDIQWFNARPPGVSHGKNVEKRISSGIVVTRAKTSNEVAEKLGRGEIDAAYTEARTHAAITGMKSVRPLFGPGDGARVISDFRRKSGLVPTNHVLLVQQGLIDRYPEIAMQLYTAFEKSKQEAYERARRAAGGYLLFPKETFAQQAALFGDDPFPSGLAANRRMLETIARELFDEGLLTSMPDVSSLCCQAMQST